MRDFHQYADEPLKPYLPNSMRRLGHKADGAIAVRQRSHVQADWTWEEVFMQDDEARKTIRYPRRERP
jgi:hypothetical protein